MKSASLAPNPHGLYALARSQFSTLPSPHRIRPMSSQSWTFTSLRARSPHGLHVPTRSRSLRLPPHALSLLTAPSSSHPIRCHSLTSASSSRLASPHGSSEHSKCPYIYSTQSPV